MLAIRLQRQGHTGYAVYRVIVQDAKHSPTSGKVVAFVGSYNPHTKENKLDIEKIEKFLNNGAQPSPRVVKLLIENKVKLPSWVEKPRTDMKAKIKNTDKLRKNQPKEATEPTKEAKKAPEEASEATESNSEPTTETPVEQAEEVGASEESEEKSEKVAEKAEEKPESETPAEAEVEKELEK